MNGLHHNKTARITGEFIGINMNDITDTITTIESIFQMHRTAKKPQSHKYVLSFFKISEKRDKKGH